MAMAASIAGRVRYVHAAIRLPRSAGGVMLASSQAARLPMTLFFRRIWCALDTRMSAALVHGPVTLATGEAAPASGADPRAARHSAPALPRAMLRPRWPLRADAAHRRATPHPANRQRD